MKSLTAVCQTGASMPAMKPQTGRISRPPQHRPNGENAEMKMYLSKLKDLVPFMPKNRKLSKLEIIQHVIDYICELQTELESHPDIDQYDGARELLATPNRHFAAAIDGIRMRAAAAANAANSNSNNDADNDNDEIIADDDDDEIDAQTANEISTEMMETSNIHDFNLLANAERLAADATMQIQQQQQQQQQQNSSPAQRQPLVDRNAPNLILPATPAAVAVTAATTTVIPAVVVQQQQQQQQSTTHTQQQSTFSTTTTEKESSRRSC